MCISFPILAGNEPGPATRLWHRVGGSPARLLGLLGALYAVVLAGLLLDGTASGRGMVFAFVGGYGVAGLPLAGAFLERVPSWTGRLPVHYVWYGGAYWAGLAALLLLAGGLWWGDGWLRTGGLLMLLSWLLVLHPLNHMRRWVRPERTAWARAAVSVVYAVTASLPLAIAAL